MHRSAIRFEKADKARTYFLINQNVEILAYFSISTKELSILDAEISKSEVKKLDGFDKKAEKINAFLIGQLAKNSQLENNPICLSHILNEINAILGEASELIGGRTIILECEDNERLIALYVHHGFKVLPMINNECSLITLYTTLIKK